jgi:D-3-phosphoglycerate dehydrogenase
MSTNDSFPSTSFPKNRIKVLLLEGIHPGARDRFAEETFQVELLPGALSEDELCERIADVHLIGIRSKTHITARALESARRLLAVGCFCIGTNQVDLGVANTRAVPVFNAPFSNTRSVAELIIAEIVILARHLGDKVQELHSHTWRKSAVGSHEVRGKTLGIIGYGHIGRQVGVLAEAFGLRVIFYDIAKQLPMGNNRSVDSMDQVLAESDYVTLHVPATNLTEGMIGAEELAKMKAGAYLLNASRGSVVDLDALADAIRGEHLAGAAIDVYPSEPRTKKSNEFESPLIGLPNVFLTPHIGGSTEEAQEAIGLEVSATLTRFVNQGSTAGAVNFPNIDLPMTEGTHRILNAHRNVPGVMRDISRILSESNANIHAQQLATDANVGYLITDLDQGMSVDVKQAIAALETSIKTRILY